MEQTFALIKNDVVLNNIVGTQGLVELMASQIGAKCVCTTGLPVQSGDDVIDGEFWNNGINRSGIHKAKAYLKGTDVANGARGVEDLIDALIAKGTITNADLPTSLVDRLAERKASRLILA